MLTTPATVRVHPVTDAACEKRQGFPCRCRLRHADASHAAEPHSTQALAPIGLRLPQSWHAPIFVRWPLALACTFGGVGGLRGACGASGASGACGVGEAACAAFPLNAAHAAASESMKRTFGVPRVANRNCPSAYCATLAPFVKHFAAYSFDFAPLGENRSRRASHSASTVEFPTPRTPANR
jgi:hypothetical protein